MRQQSLPILRTETFEEALQASLARCDHRLRLAGLEAALGNPPVRRCLEIMAEIRLRRQREGES